MNRFFSVTNDDVVFVSLVSVYSGYRKGATGGRGNGTKTGDYLGSPELLDKKGFLTLVGRNNADRRGWCAT
jgi:hypothetical protein